jgi:hypothetical protein
MIALQGRKTLMKKQRRAQRRRASVIWPQIWRKSLLFQLGGHRKSPPVKTRGGPRWSMAEQLPVFVFFSQNMQSRSRNAFDAPKRLRWKLFGRKGNKNLSLTKSNKKKWYFLSFTTASTD